MCTPTRTPTNRDWRICTNTATELPPRASGHASRGARRFDAARQADGDVENKELSERGELIDAQALTGPRLAKFIVHDGQGTPVVTDGPFPESKELLAGHRVVDVESPVRALEIAAKISAAPALGGAPIKQPPASDGAHRAGG
jgi:hypothetical protein